MYTNRVFEIINKTLPSKRDELEISSVNNVFVKDGTCDYAILKDSWADAGTMDSYHNTNRIVYQGAG
jgi:glucose-1-phosphate thymidylyltransferase